MTIEPASETLTSVSSGRSAGQARSIPSLDGLRGVAVLLVVMAHMGVFALGKAYFLGHGQRLLAVPFSIDAGDLGVSTFFVISGFLITTLLIRKDDAAGRISLDGFYARRFFRIFPPYYFYLGVVCLLALVRLVPMPWNAMVSAATYTSNYYPYRLSDPAGAGWLVGHTWSLSLEEQFYLVWPGCLHFLGRKRSAWLGVCLMALAPWMRVLTLHRWPAWGLHGQIDRMFHTRIDTIMAGCVLALLGTWPGIYRTAVAWVNRRWTGAVAAVLLFADMFASDRSGSFERSGGLLIEAILLAYLLLYCIANANSFFGRLLNVRPLRHIGVISYGLYLWQQMFDGPVQLFRAPALVRLGCIVLAAECSYLLVERPSYKVRDWWLARRSG